LQIENALARPDERGRGHEAGHFIARPERLFQPALARNAAVLGMREDRARDPLGVALLFQDFAAAERVIVERRPSLVVEVVEQADNPPRVFVLAERARVAADRGL